MEVQMFARKCLQHVTFVAVVVSWGASCGGGSAPTAPDDASTRGGAGGTGGFDGGAGSGGASGGAGGHAGSGGAVGHGGASPTAPDLAVQVSPTTLSVGLGGTASVVVTVAPTGGYTGPVTLNYAGAPTNVAVTIESSYLTEAPFTTTLTVEVDTRAQVGTSMLTLTASGTGIASATLMVPLIIPGLQDGKFAAASLGVGGGNACVLVAGKAYCWGANSYGQIGNGSHASVNNAYVPTPVAGGLTFAALAVGGDSNCGLTPAGAAYCWGANRSGQLGNGTTTDSDVPVAVSGNIAFASLSAANTGVCGLTADGAAYCWGSGGPNPDTQKTPARITFDVPFKSISRGAGHACGLTAAGAAVCWGANLYGELGWGDAMSSDVPVSVMGGLVFAKLDAGMYRTCGITVAGAAYCWGRNDQGQLGNGAKKDSLIPVPVSGGLQFASISSRPNSTATCGVTTSGAAYCWGDNRESVYGDGSSTASLVPVAAARSLELKALETGSHTSCGRTTSDMVYCWGYPGTSGTLGVGKSTFAGLAVVPVPVQPPSP